MVKPVKYYKKNGLVQQDLQIIPLFHCKMPVLLSTSLFIIQPHLPCEIESPFPLYSVRDKREPLLTSYHFSIVHAETMPACYIIMLSHAKRLNAIKFVVILRSMVANYLNSDISTIYLLEKLRKFCKVLRSTEGQRNRSFCIS